MRRNLNELISVLDINITKLCRKTNYDPSTVFRIKNGSRQPSDPVSFARSVAEYVANELDSDQSLAILAKLLNASESQLKTAESRTEAVGELVAVKKAPIPMRKSRHFYKSLMSLTLTNISRLLNSII